ncbi:hypothetical protein BJ322DRAFT_1017194 [Thelephora terrestris]|uniref:Uncharacterized protein n=1 Tax=Thelephora terrestris TaxID=56493 RepID=A0A9P6HMD5_9AGAM|nr:hypothetical protein BJ322DRAFT_1017194 [Thelephora terrestris]
MSVVNASQWGIIAELEAPPWYIPTWGEYPRSDNVGRGHTYYPSSSPELQDQHVYARGHSIDTTQGALRDTRWIIKGITSTIGFTFSRDILHLQVTYDRWGLHLFSPPHRRSSNVLGIKRTKKSGTSNGGDICPTVGVPCGPMSRRQGDGLSMCNPSVAHDPREPGQAGLKAALGGDQGVVCHTRSRIRELVQVALGPLSPLTHTCQIHRKEDCGTEGRM